MFQNDDVHEGTRQMLGCQWVSITELHYLPEPQFPYLVNGNIDLVTSEMP